MSSAGEATYPEEQYCPISQELMKDPVIAEDGHTYERRAITEWFRRSGTSPMTREVMETRKLVPNHALRKIIEDSTGGEERASRPTVRRNPPTSKSLRRIEYEEEWERVYAERRLERAYAERDTLVRRTERAHAARDALLRDDKLQDLRKQLRWCEKRVKECEQKRKDDWKHWDRAAETVRVWRWNNFISWLRRRIPDDIREEIWFLDHFSYYHDWETELAKDRVTKVQAEIDEQLKHRIYEFNAPYSREVRGGYE